MDEEVLVEEIVISKWIIDLPETSARVISEYICCPDVFALLEQVSKHGFLINQETREFAYSIIAHKMFKNRVKLHKLKSYKELIMRRPRVRLNGLYSLRIIYNRRPSNERFWEETRYEDIEVNFHRHFRFLPNGQCLYSLDVRSPDEISVIMRRALPIQKVLYKGIYVIDKGIVEILVNLNYTVMRFKLKISDGNERAAFISGTTYQPRGKFNCLRLFEHASLGKIADEIDIWNSIEKNCNNNNDDNNDDGDSGNSSIMQMIKCLRRL